MRLGSTRVVDSVFGLMHTLLGRRLLRTGKRSVRPRFSFFWHFDVVNMNFFDSTFKFDTILYLP